MVSPIFLGQSTSAVTLLPNMANRHGLIAGATGTGKTVTLQGLAESFSQIGVPVFAADIKGDLSGVSQAGKPHPKISERVEVMGLSDFGFTGFPVTCWDVYGKQGHPLRATISDMGPLLLSRLMNLNDTQQGILNLVFRVADDNGWLVLDLKDLRAMLQFIAENAAEFRTLYGNISAASVGAIQRRLLGLEEQGAAQLFGEPMLNLDDLLQTDEQGRGVINLLAADSLMQSPNLYSAFLLWLLSELFEQLPEVGDPEKPKLVLFFDEAHLLFDDTPKVLLNKIEQVVRLIRSKGVGVYFVTQNPTDIPDSVLGQLGNRIQHALRAYTVKDQKALKAAAETFRDNPAFDTRETLTSLGVGEALVSTLDEKGRPQIVQQTLIKPPQSQIGPVTEQQRQTLLRTSLVAGVYDKTLDRESAYEVLAERALKAQEAEQSQPADVPKTTARRRETALEAFAKSTMRAIGSQLGRRIVRGILGSLLGKK
ncbi:protein of unknown function DUF853, NPT hydrolase putative [Methylophaga aminisulfidivorans MP]|uniref:Helicase HerA-like C-terminal domain-containing protein n=1 Tax=Methylophaga aminisulfidivorans MP TaxID=1026882 RepID=F5T208_9GAMM|nr:helicase HerA-like C-terminal domain-containing protein [Methylophaga aminisulfidivorans]EGL53148.1 protein of unknown function DUF853, NPT hydrolase putative [Methylophaga aminisulfidivorans MP]